MRYGPAAESSGRDDRSNGARLLLNHFVGDHVVEIILIERKGSTIIDEGELVALSVDNVESAFGSANQGVGGRVIDRLTVGDYHDPMV